MEETVALIKSCIISKKGGVAVDELDDEFARLVGERIPYRRLGFANLRTFLKTISGLQMGLNEFGEYALTINDSKISHIDRLIRKQKIDYSKTKNKYYKQFTHRRSDCEYNNERRQKNRLTSSINRANIRTQNLDRRRDRDYVAADGLYRDKRDSYEEEENHYPVVIQSKFKKTDVIYEPIGNGQQLLGDDFFLQLAIRNLGLPIWRYGDSLALHCGLCISGQSISECTRALKNVSSISNRVVILLGSVDIYNGATCDEMIYDMTELLELLQSKFHLSRSAITVCTLPPLANIAIYAHKNKSMALFCFNNWIRSLVEDIPDNEPCLMNYEVIDLFVNFSNETYTTEFDWFQTQARRVSGTKHAYVLWNKKGRKQAMSLICGR